MKILVMGSPVFPWGVNSFGLKYIQPGLHPLHQYPAIAVYAAVSFWPRLRLLGIGLIIHMALDGVDCVWMQYEH